MQTPCKNSSLPLLLKDHQSKLFGTDGIRAPFGTYPLTTKGIQTIGHAVARFFQKQPAYNNTKNLLLAHDGRQSATFIEQHLVPYLEAANLCVQSLGLLSTPGLSFMIKETKALGGLMISASHNPATDNGLKIFTAVGQKTAPLEEHVIEDLCTEEPPALSPAIHIEKRTPKAYITHLARTAQTVHLENLQIVCDTANGAFSDLAQRVLPLTGAHCHFVACTPDGTNINDNCGATHSRLLCETVHAQEASLGIAFDGDGDRVILCNKQGQLLDGDHILAFLATFLRETDQKITKVVSTILANTGLEKYLSARGISLIRTAVGDRAIAEGLRTHNTILAAEPSGHLLFAGDITGDGLLNALRFLKLWSEAQYPPLEPLFTPYHQETQNILLGHIKQNILDDINASQAALQRLCNADTRLILRKSGTEPVLRVFVESPHKKSCLHTFDRIMEQLLVG